MSYQSKTTLLVLTGEYQQTESAAGHLFVCFKALHEVAIFIATRCQMDSMSVTPYSLPATGDECHLDVVFVNNGRSLNDIITIMKPEKYVTHNDEWRMSDLEDIGGYLHTFVTVKHEGDTWEEAS